VLLAGTLTVQGLELQSIVPVNNGRFEPPSTDMQLLPPDVPQLLASCHGLALLGDTLVGDPLDQKLFAASGWSLVDKEDGQYSPASAATANAAQQLAVVHPPGRPAAAVAVVRRFEFSSQLQRNLVVVQLGVAGAGAAAGPTGGSGSPVTAAAAAAGRAPEVATANLLDSHMSGPLVSLTAPAPAAQSAVADVPSGVTHVLYAKGSPEMIKSLVAASSLPPDFDRLLAEYTKEGLRVLALARGVVVPGSLPERALASYSQQQLEAAVQLELTGLAVLANPLRPDTAGAIQALQKAQVGWLSHGFGKENMRVCFWGAHGHTSRERKGLTVRLLAQSSLIWAFHRATCATVVLLLLLLGRSQKETGNA
jgi:cation-transporting ATPase 13A3/4/5